MRKIFPFLFCFFSIAAFAGNPGVTVQGSITPGDFAKFVNGWTIQDGGSGGSMTWPASAGVPYYNGTTWGSNLNITTTGTSGAATLVGNTLNIPQYSGGGVTSINTTTGAFTFTGSGVSCTGTTCTFSGGGAVSSLTTTGSSGAATLISGVLNIPTYTLSGLGGAPLNSPTFTGTVAGASANWSGVSAASHFNATDATANLLPVGTTGARPSGAEGMIRDNTTIASLEVYLSGVWQPIISGLVNLASQVTGTLPVANGGTGATTVGAAQARLQTTGPILVNGCCDSITERHSTYFPYPYGVSAGLILPAWVPLTVYPLNSWVQNGGLVYVAVVGGTSGNSGGPTGSSPGTDGTVTWQYQGWQATKGTDYLTWLEYYSGGAIYWDQTDGYATVPSGAGKVDIQAGGSNYSGADTFSCTGGLKITPTFTSGALTAATVVNPGIYGTCTITTSTGSGAIFTVISGGGGTFGVSGTFAYDAVARLPDMIASRANLFVIHVGTNDIGNNRTYGQITSNLQTIYETLRSAGKKVIAIPILPRGIGLTEAQAITAYRVNKWIRAYARMEPWANPNQIQIGLADPTGYFTDGTVTTSVNNAVGGTSGAATSFLETDGLHPNARGMQYLGYSIYLAAKQLYQTGVPDYSSRNYTPIDAYDYVVNPSGNMLEGILWSASQPVVLGSLVNNGGNSYYCVQAGTTASSGGPSGTGSNITDGSAKWTYRWPAYMSVFGSGTTGTDTAATGIVFSGNLAGGYTLARNSGSAAGTITQSIENPWSNGQAGTRQVVTFSLGSGTATEQWMLYTPNVFPVVYGITSSDIGATKYFMEMEVELSSIAHFTGVSVQFVGSGYSTFNGLNGAGTAQTVAAQTGEPIVWPNNNRIFLRTTPLIIPSLATYIAAKVFINFDASGGAASSTATIKFNHIGLYRWLGS